MTNGNNATIGFEKQIWDAAWAYLRSRTLKREDIKIGAAGKCKPPYRQ